MKKLITFILLLIGILSFRSLNIYAHDVTYTLDKDLTKTEWIIKDIDNPITLIDPETPEEPTDEPFLTTNEIMKLVTTLVIYIVALFVGMLAKSKLLIAMTGLLWLIPLVTINSLIIKLFSVIILIISFTILLKERDDYYD
jgi:hypothetical protein